MGHLVKIEFTGRNVNPCIAPDTVTYLHIHAFRSLFGTTKKIRSEQPKLFLFGGLFGFHGISTFVGYLTPNPFLNK